MTIFARAPVRKFAKTVTLTATRAKRHFGRVLKLQKKHFPNELAQQIKKIV
jgi:hypothetical protein